MKNPFLKRLGLQLACLGSFLLLTSSARSDWQHPHLVDIETVNPYIVVDLRYATADNFTGEVVYDFHKCYLRKEVAQAISDVQVDLEMLGFGLKIWDGYRPMQAQWKFWNLVPDERYVSHPSKGGRHTRGTAVDVTLVYEGKEVPMPSAFDDFSERAHRNFADLPPEILDNRNLLEEVMRDHGFIGLDTEWWHFDYVGWENCPVIEVENDELE